MKKRDNIKIHISVRDQQLTLKSGRKKLARYPVSTSRFGLGTEKGSLKTPTGRFRIAEVIGAGMPMETIFIGRRPAKVTKVIKTQTDLIMTRILWLDGLEDGNANTRERFIYIHGTNHEERVGKPSSRGCIRMRKADIVKLFEEVGVDTTVVIEA